MISFLIGTASGLFLFAASVTDQRHQALRLVAVALFVFWFGLGRELLR